MDYHVLMEQVSAMEYQSRNEELMRMDEMAKHRDTSVRLNTIQGELVFLKEREKQLIEKNANLSAIKETSEMTVKQLNEEVKGSKKEITILKEYATKQEELMRKAKIDFIQKLDDMNEEMRKRKSDMDKIAADSKGLKTIGDLDGDMHADEDIKKLKDKNTDLENQLSSILQKFAELQNQFDAGNQVRKGLEDEMKQLNGEVEKCKEYETSAQKAIGEYQEYVSELQAELKQPCPNCGQTRESDVNNA